MNSAGKLLLLILIFVYKSSFHDDRWLFSVVEVSALMLLFGHRKDIRPVNSLLLVWHAPLGVRSTIHRHQSPQRAVLSQVDCFVQCEVVGSHIALNSVQPRGTRTPWWSLPVLW